MKSPQWRQRFWKPSMSFSVEVLAARVRTSLGAPRERIPLLPTFNLSFHFFLHFTMKRYFFLLAAMALLASCTSDVLENATSDNGIVSHVTMTATDFELDAATRTALEITSSGLSFTWAESDVVGIYPNAGDQVSFPMTKGAGTKTANFDGGGWALKGNYTYAAYYPYDAGNTFYARPYTALPISYLGQKQPANNSTAGLGAYDYMVATASTPESGNVTFNFQHINSVLYIQLTSPDAATFTKLTLSCDDAIFVTDATVNISNGTLTPTTTANEITLDLENFEIAAGGVLKALMMIAPVNATGKTLSITATAMSGKNYVAEIAGKDFQTGKGYMLSGMLEDAEKNYEKDYLTFEAIESTTFTFSKNALQYSIDDGLTWTTLPAGTASPTIKAGDRIIWKASGLTPTLNDGIGTFSSTGRFKTEGNIMSLLFGDNFVGKTSLNGYNYAFYGLFSFCSKLESANLLILPATSLAIYCYHSMFYGCTSLTTAPELPAISLSKRCYGGMFLGCTSLITAPELPATTLATECYVIMFGGCTSLTTAPELPATTLTEHCYDFMFNYCTSLAAAPELPATTLSEYCYCGMFHDCTSLTTAPDLPAKTLATECYANMFEGCTSLTIAPELPATTLISSCYAGMFFGCTSLTTAPELLATELAERCYDNLFNGCTSLATAPELPATTLVSSCYAGMFSGCTSLTTAPELPATELAESCYDKMFNGCTCLTNAPVLPARTMANYCYNSMFRGCIMLSSAPTLPATTLASGCYFDMFFGCTSLQYIKCLAMETSSTRYTSGWVSGVASTGTFVKNAKINSWSTGDNGIPEGWTVQNE